MPPADATAAQGSAQMRLPRLGLGARVGKGAMATWHVESAAPPPGGRFVALVPGAEAPLMEVSLPASLRGEARETVARRQLVDRLGLDLSQVELRPAPLGTAAGGWQAMLMVRKADVAGWRARLAGQGKAVQAILPDYLALPVSADVWTVETGAEPGAPVRARLGPGDGFSTEAALAGLTLAQALEEEGRAPPKALLRLGPALPELDEMLEAALARHPGVPMVESVEALPAEVARPQVLAHGEMALDLSVQMRDPRREIEARLRGALWPAALFLLAGAIWAGATYSDILKLRAEARAVQDRNIALVREAFLPSGPLPDIRLQVARLIEERRAALANAGPGPEPPFTRLRRASSVLAEAEAEGIRLDMASLQPDGLITLELAAPDFAALEALLE
ncbi:MAG: type II secretion system protein GspL, partial [Roseovarius sp.]